MGQEDAGVAVQVEALEETVQDAVEEAQEEDLEEIQISGADQML